MRCPLPIDWLEYVEGEPSESLSLHLPECHSCQLLVDELRRERREQFRPSHISIKDSWPQWYESKMPTAAFGEIWFAISLDRSTQELPRIPVLVASELWQEANRSWCEIVPLWNDVENATSLDLVLRKNHTDLNIFWRAFLRYQTVAEISELDARIGKLTPDGEVIVQQALAGNAPEECFGSPIVSPEDSRINLPEEIETAVKLLGQQYAQLTEEKSGDKQPNISWFQMRRSDAPEPANVELSLAASTLKAEDLPWIADIPERGRIRGKVEYQIPKDELVFVIEGISEAELGLNLPMCIRFSCRRLPKPVVSEHFMPRVDKQVLLGQDLAILPGDINSLELGLAYGD